VVSFQGWATDIVIGIKRILAEVLPNRDMISSRGGGHCP
jgi:hypothetical protein